MELNEIFRVDALIRDVTNWLIMLIPAAGGGMVAYHSFAKNGATEESEANQHSRAQKKIIVGSAIGTASVGIVNYVVKYFGTTPPAP